MANSSPAYNFRIIPEIAWAIGIAVVIALAEAAMDFDGSVFSGDPGAWAGLLVGSLIRAAGGAALTVLTKGAFLKPGEQPSIETTG